MNHSEKRVLTNELTGLKALLCNPAGEVVITGSLADRQEIAAHLGALTDLSNDPAEDEGEEAASAPTAGPTLLDDAIRKTIEVLEDMPTHHPHYSIWTNHLTQLLEIERDQLRHPLHRSSYNWIGLDVGGGDDMTVQKITTNASNGRLPPDVVDAEFPPTFIDFKSLPSGDIVRKSFYELLRGVMLNARPGGYNRSVVTYPRWHYVQQATGLGSTYSQQLCQHFGLNPDEQL